VATLKRWHSEALSRAARERVWTAAARLQAVITTAAMDEAQRSAWCREQGIFPSDLQQWQQNATAVSLFGKRVPVAHGWVARAREMIGAS
jgi:hypothetical protein